MTLSSVLATVMRYDNAKDRALAPDLELSAADLTAQQFQSRYTYNIPSGVIISLAARPCINDHSNVWLRLPIGQQRSDIFKKTIFLFLITDF